MNWISVTLLLCGIFVISVLISSTMNVSVCPCCALQTVNTRFLIRHIGLRHAHERDFSVTCGIDGCRQYFRVYSSFRRHVWRKHQYVLMPDSDRSVSETAGSGSMTFVQQQGCMSSSEEHDICDENVDMCSETSDLAVVKSFGLFCLKLKEKHGVTDTVISSVVSSVTDLVKENLESFQQKIVKELKYYNVTITDNSELSNLLMREPSLPAECETVLGTAKNRLKYYSDNFPLVHPTEIYLGTNATGKSNSLAYVSVRDTIKCWLSDSDMFNLVTSASCHYGKTRLTDVYDGSLVTKFPEFLDRYCLQLLLYCDDFEVANPLGSKRGVHKLFAVYFTLLNMPLKYRSKLENLQLVLLVRSSYVTKYGLQVILMPLLNELTDMQSAGIDVSVDGSQHHFTGRIALVCGDNLAANKLAGFTQNFTHGRICRFCMATRSDISALHLESLCTLRTPEMHASHLSAVLADKSMASAYGVVADSPLAVLNGFDVTLLFAPDVMHDLLEGVIPLTIKHMLRSIVTSSNDTSISVINSRMQKLPVKFGKNTYLPQPLTAAAITGDNAVMGTASERWCLLRILPFLISLSDCSEAVSGAYLDLREITDILMARSIPKPLVAQLAVCVSNFLLNFQHAFPGVSMTPKMHFLVHYPRYLQLIGPLTSVWTMRFEGKHFPFKQFAQKIRNWKNIAMSLAKRHQLVQCYTFSAPSSLKTSIEATGLSEIQMSHLPSDLLSHLSTLTSFDEANVSKSKSVSSALVHITLNNVYPLRWTEFHLPVFLVVYHILHYQHRIFVCGKPIISAYFDPQHWAYVGEESSEWEIVHCYESYIDEMFIDSHPVVVYEVDDKLYVVAQYGLYGDEYACNSV